MGDGGRRARLATLSLALALGYAALAGATERAHFTAYECADFRDGYEFLGVTDVNGAVGHGRLSVGVNREGTVSVLKWPNPSYYDQVKYFTVDREEDYEDEEWDRYRRRDVNFGVLDNEGVFAGLALRLRGGRHVTTWLREYSRGWRISQRYDSPDSDTLVTVWRNRRLGLTVTGVDVVPPMPGRPQRDLLVRHYAIDRDGGSPVEHAELMAFANLNPVAAKAPWIPEYDVCQESATNHSRTTAYDALQDAIAWTGRGPADSVAIAMGFSEPSSGHQVGADALDPWSGARRVGGAPQDAYLDAVDGELGGNDSVAGLATAALSRELSFDQGRAGATLLFGFGASEEVAARALREGRGAPAAEWIDRSARSWRPFLATAPLPDLAADPSLSRGERAVLLETAKRSLMVLRMMVADSGAIVASVTTQPPYGLDWVRDGYWFNHALGVAGHHSLVTAHNRFYARLQTGAPGSVPFLPRPPGNWAMNYYADGVESGPLPYEIDETGFGAATLWEHYRRLRGVIGARRSMAYLREVFPAIGRAADWLTACRDPRTGLLCPQTEDDHYDRVEQTLHGAIPAVMALRGAIVAGRLLGDPRVDRWRERLRTLVAGIDTPVERGGYWNGRRWEGDWGDLAWVIWPGRYRPYHDPAMQATARHIASVVRSRMEEPRPHGGQYEGKAIHALAALAAETGDERLLAIARRQAAWLGTYVPTRDTRLYGEHYYNACSAEPVGNACPATARRSVPSVSLPHAWAHTLFYLSALSAWGPAPYRLDGSRFSAGITAR